MPPPAKVARISGGRDTLAGLAGEYLDHLVVERGVSPHTVQAYRRDLERYVRFCSDLGVTEADDVSQALVGDFLRSMRAGQPGQAPLSASSAARAVVAVRGLHRYAVREGRAVADPAAIVKPPGTPRPLPKGLPVTQVEALLRAPDPTVPVGIRDRAVLEFLYGSGCRVGEAVTMDIDDLDLTSRSARLMGKGRKERLVPIGGLAVAALESYLVRVRPGYVAKGRGTKAVFLNQRGGRLTRQSIWVILKRSAVAAGLGTAVHPHTLRHSCATHLLEGGADVRVVQELLGHSSVTTTQIYTMVTIEHLREVHANTHPRGRD